MIPASSNAIVNCDTVVDEFKLTDAKLVDIFNFLEAHDELKVRSLMKVLRQSTVE